MNERRFVAERAERWRELGERIERAQRSGLRGLPGRDVRRLGALYRATASDLATARTIGCSEETLRHVNRLCAAAHDLVYSTRRRSPAKALGTLLAVEFPRLVRSTLRFHVTGAALFALAGVAAFVVFRSDPDLVDRTFGPTLRRRAERAAAAPADARRYLELRGTFAPFFSWGIIAHNITVSLIAYALTATTVLAGAFHAILMGVMLGGVLALFLDLGVPDVIAGFVSAHGPLELTALFLVYGAGFRTGLAWLLPGRRSRLAAFQQAGRESVTILLGTTLMLVVAGLIEGFVSPAPLPVALKAAIGIVTWGAFALYVAFAGRPVTPPAAP